MKQTIEDKNIILVLALLCSIDVPILDIEYMIVQTRGIISGKSSTMIVTNYTDGTMSSHIIKSEQLIKRSFI